MAEMKNRDLSSPIVESIDGYSMVTDVLKSLWAIILGAAAVAMIVNMMEWANYSSTYTTTATFVVTSKDSGNYTYVNLNAAQTMADSFTNILNSALLKKKVCQDLSISEFDATASASVIAETNLLTLTVTSSTPEKAYRIIRSIMKNYTSLTQYVSGNMIMQVLQQPAVPTGADTSFSALNKTLRWFVYAFLLFTLLFMVLSYQHDTIKAEQDLTEKLITKDLGMIYHERQKGFPLKRKKEPLLITDVNAGFEYVERFKKTSALVSSQARSHEARTLLVTSVVKGEGKSTIAANLALTLAKQDYKVALIDANFRNPSLASILHKEVTEEQSIGNQSSQAGRSITYDADKKLYLGLESQARKNSTDIVTSDRMIRIIQTLKKHLDYIIIDSPAMSQAADAEAIASYADMSLLVVRYNRLEAQDINDAIDSLRDCNAKFGGCILNEVKTLPGGRRATAGYGSYGRYGRYGRYGGYGGYGGYGAYGRYGAYGHYGAAAMKEEHAENKKKSRKESKA
ncbi:MAG: CpsD/CapB family tyrosine-protein kinase [Eubacteriales bacterium]|nr:CpsD/CapB family tyrosine-protein kinase [Eubacteriales bacterium]